MADSEKKDEGIKEATEKGVVALVDKVYTDALQPTMKKVGSLFGAMAGRVDSKFSGMRLRNAMDETLESTLIHRLVQILKEQGVPDEDIIEPPAKVAVPALSGIALEDSNEVREMYLKVLAASMDRNRASRAHPGFINLLNQITQDEALIIAILHTKPVYPAVRMVALYSSLGESVVISRNFSLLGVEACCVHPELTQMYLGNLNRLGVTAVEECTCDEEHGDYDALIKHPRLLKETEEFNRNLSEELKKEQEIKFLKYHIRLTTYGRQFAAACLA